jgi:calpain-5
LLILFQELCTNPKLFVGGVSRDDVKQGQLGNCWFVAALSCLASVKQYWNKVTSLLLSSL